MGRDDWDELDAMARMHHERIAPTINRLLDSTAPLYQPDPRGQPSTIGSGVFLRVREHRFLLSASHVCERASPHRPISAGARTTIEDLGFRWRTPPLTGDLAPGREDMAIFELGPMCSDGFRETPFLTLDDLDPYLLAEEECARASYLVIGYPRSLQPRQAQGSSLSPVPRPLVTLSRPFAEYAPLRVSPETHLLLSYDRRGFHNIGRAQQEPDPHGMSGGGVWRLTGLRGEGNVTAKLVGILIEYHQTPSPSLLATRIVSPLGALRRKRPDLKPYIDTQFPFVDDDAA
jgi:hypothetical protein